MAPAFFGLPLLTACGVAPDAFADLPVEEVAAEDPTIDVPILEAMRSQEIVGLGVGVVEGGEIVYLRGYGWHTWPDVPFEAITTRVRWASISKSITAAVAARAAVRGEVDLDEDITGLLTSWSPPANWAGAPVTLRLLLGHLAGMRHYGDALFDGAPPTWLADDPAVNTGMEWALTYWVRDELVNQPREAFHYSSYGYNLAGVVLEHALGGTLDECARTEIFDPLGMESAAPDRQWEAGPERATGYTRDLFGSIVPAADTDVSWKLASGGYHSTVEDLTRWCQGMVNGEVLDEDTRALLWTEGTTTDGEGTGYGLGFNVNRDTVSHSGGNEKAVTLFKAWPEEGRCIVLMSNSGYAALGPIMEALSER